MKLSLSHVQEYLSHLLGSDVHVLALEPITDRQVASTVEEETNRQTLQQNETQAFKIFGYGQSVLVRYRVADDERRAVLQTMATTPFGYERRADRAADILLTRRKQRSKNSSKTKLLHFWEKRAASNSKRSHLRQISLR